MSLGHAEWPETGEMVVATVSRLETYGAYVTLDEYVNKEALLHISEISSRWVRNIRNHVRENQKVVLQVLRVDPFKGQVDLSLRRVNKDDRRKKIEQWKKTRKAETLLKQAATELKATPEDLFEEISPKLNEAQINLYDALEQAAKKGMTIFTDLGIKTKTAEALATVAKDKIIVKGVTIQGATGAEVVQMGVDTGTTGDSRGWFVIDTPVGTYNPDWAILKHDGQALYLVKETKGTKDFWKLRTAEADKVRCGQKHFAAIGVPFAVAVSADEV